MGHFVTDIVVSAHIAHYVAVHYKHGWKLKKEEGWWLINVVHSQVLEYSELKHYAKYILEVSKGKFLKAIKCP